MTIMSRNELEEVLELLGSFKGRHTELISVYISEGYDVISVQKQLEAEKSTAKNIKSTATRNNVANALDKIIRTLKTFKKTPENGMALFSGNVSKTEGQEDLQIWIVEPPLPIKTRLYRCDKEFVLEPLQELLEAKEIYGLLVMDRKEATIGILEGKRIEMIQKMTSGIPSKVRAGGQCLSPEMPVETKKGIKKIENLKIGDEIRAFDLINDKIIFTKVKNKWNVVKSRYNIISVKDCWQTYASDDHTFFKIDANKVVEIPSKDLKIGDDLISFNQNNEIYLIEIKDIKSINEKLEMIDIETEKENFFANGILVHNSSQRFHRITEGLTRDFYKRIAEEMKKIFYENSKLSGIIIGGPIPTKDEFLDGNYLATKLQEKVIGKIDIGNADESGLSELVEKSKDILANQEIVYEKKLLEKFFETLGERPDFAVYKEEDIRKALEYGAVETLLLSGKIDKSLIKELKEKAERISAKVEFVSTDTTEGEQFRKLSGIGALLRFKI